jgi:hypothetical protein
VGRPDRVDMDTVATAEAMSLVAATGERMGYDWRDVRSRLDGLIGQLGQRELGAAFLDGYQAPATETASVVEQYCRVPGRFAAMGNRCVAEYEAADSNGRDTFDAVDEATPPASSRPA